MSTGTVQIGIGWYFQRCSCGMQGPSRKTREEAVAAWNIAMGAKLRDAAQYIVDNIDCLGDMEIKRRLAASLKGPQP
jgi:hypothetical protein